MFPYGLFWKDAGWNIVSQWKKFGVAQYHSRGSASNEFEVPSDGRAARQVCLSQSSRIRQLTTNSIVIRHCSRASSPRRIIFRATCLFSHPISAKQWKQLMPPIGQRTIHTMLSLVVPSHDEN